MKEYTAAEAAEVLDDPDGHFPYKHTAAVEGHVNPNHGKTSVDGYPLPGADGPEYFTVPAEEADAVKAYIDAQQNYLEHPGDAAAMANVDWTADQLVAVRRRLRDARGASNSVAGNAFRTGV